MSSKLYSARDFIHVQYCDVMRFTVLHKRHLKVSQSVPFIMHCKTVTILLTIRVRRHFVMSITKNHEPHYVTVLDNPRINGRVLRRLPLRSLLLYKVHPPFSSFFSLVADRHQKMEERALFPFLSLVCCCNRLQHTSWAF